MNVGYCKANRDYPMSVHKGHLHHGGPIPISIW